MRWSFMLLCFIIIIGIVYFYILRKKENTQEFFNQQSPFVMKTNENIYDDFYAKLNDTFYDNKKTSNYMYNLILANTAPTEYSRILDIGSGTGELVNEFITNGFNAEGVDHSSSMIQCSKEKYDYLPVKCGEATDSLNYENQTFTHITLLGLTIYEIKDINCLMRNVYGWLLHNGYFIVHLVDKDKYNPLIPICNPLTDDNFQKYTTKRITRGKIDFGDFVYNQNVDFSKADEVVIEESFTNKSVRKQEHSLYMKDMKDMISTICNYGFIVKGKVELQMDSHQYIYIFEKI